ncbi:MAG: GPW/gp25 family protein [Proteobacteria bacterium]|nr:GPW/gp25 family protein [Pseudomonadota bacterium]
MNAETGRSITELDHIRQSIRKILTTPTGTRVMRRDFGSRLPDLVDMPMTPANRLRVIAATAEAIMRWEPRIRVSQVTLSAEVAAMTVTLSGTLKRGGDAEISVALGRG